MLKVNRWPNFLRSWIRLTRGFLSFPSEKGNRNSSKSRQIVIEHLEETFQVRSITCVILMFLKITWKSGYEPMYNNGVEGPWCDFAAFFLRLKIKIVPAWWTWYLISVTDIYWLPPFRYIQWTSSTNLVGFFFFIFYPQLNERPR